MVALKITSKTETEFDVSNNMFGVNTVAGASGGSRDANGAGGMTDLSADALGVLGTSTLRFPGGLADEYFSDGMLTHDGTLPAGLTEFLNQAQGLGLKVVLVVSVRTPHGQSDAEFKSDLSTFSHLIETHFGDVVAGYELGNEYYAGRSANDDSVEHVYGTDAGHAALAINGGLADPDAVNIFIQGANNVAGAHDNSINKANEVIRNAVDAVGDLRSVIDGVTRNVYFQEHDNDGFSNDYESGGSTRLDVTFAGWDEWASRDLIERIGEYNVKADVAKDMMGHQGLDVGDQGAGMLLEHFTHLIDSSVDDAAIWPLSFDYSATSLFNNADAAITIATVADLELMTNTTRAAMFDLLGQTVVGHTFVEAEWSLGQKNSPDTEMDVEFTLFQDSEFGSGLETEYVAFLSSRNSSVQTIGVDFGALVGNGAVISIRGISIDNEVVENPAQGIGGRNSVNQADAILADVTNALGDGISFSLTLQPYEVVQITMVVNNGVDSTTADEPTTLTGTNGADDIAANGVGNTIEGLGGDDDLTGNDGIDEIYGGNGSDTIAGGNSNDKIYGGKGNDIIFGDDSNDRIYGGWGSDTIEGGTGHDKLHGGGSNDMISGGRGRDWIEGGKGNDLLRGDEHADAFVFKDGDGFDTVLDFEDGLDRIDLRAHSVDDFADIILVQFHQGDSTLIRFKDDAGQQDNDLGGIVLQGVEFGTQVDVDDFIF